MNWTARFREDDLHGIRFAANVFVGATIVWMLLQHVVGISPIWAIASLVAASEPIMRESLRMSRSSLINTGVGCAIGLVVLLTGGTSEWRLPFAMAIAVLVSTYFVRIPNMWRQAPTTAAIVIASGLMQHSRAIGVEQGLGRVSEVVFGCIVGIAVSWMMSKAWPMPEPAKHAAA